MSSLGVGSFSRLISNMKTGKVTYFACLIGQGLGEAILYTAIAFATKDMVQAYSEGNMNLIKNGAITLGIALLFLSVFMPILNYFYKRSIKNAVAYIRTSIFKHILRLPISFYEKNHSGDTISRITNDIQLMEVALTNELQMVVSNVILGICSIIFMFVFEWRITLLLIILSAVLAGINILFAKPIRRISDKIQSKFSVLTQRFQDILTGYYTMKVFGIEKKLLSDYEAENNEVTKLLMKRIKNKSFLECTNYFLGMTSFTVTVGIGCIMVLNKITDFATITGIVMLQINVTNAFFIIGAFVAKIQTSLAGASRVFELEDTPFEPISYNLESRTSSKCMVMLDKVSFGYEKGHTVLKDITIKVGKGETVALVGASGGGKSSIVKLLLGYYPPDKGNIIVNGQPLKNYTLPQIREMIAYVPQDTSLFNATIRDNILYGNILADDEKIIEASKAANAHEFIMGLPEGYDTKVGDKGALLSGGQRQRILIARAFLKNSPLVILDEPTSALDAENEKLIKEALQKLLEGRTVIIVAHRLSTIEHADKIYVIHNGNIAEEGEPSELIQKKGIYYALNNKQNINSMTV